MKKGLKLNQSIGDPEKTIYFITGASGVGKTTLMYQLEKKYSNEHWLFVHADSAGVPPSEEIKKKYGSASAWQEIKTHEWIGRLVNEYDNEKIFFEGQANLEFIHAGFQKNNFKNYKIILIDCREDEMAVRLTHKRNQPELLTKEMRNWLKFLRHQAQDLKVPIIDTNNLSEAQVLREFEKITGL